jgi:hypothetical protein
MPVMLEFAGAGSRPDTHPLLRDITELYRIERIARLLDLNHEERGLLRHARAKPVLKRLQRRFRALEDAAPPSGYLREAVTYANGRWPHLMRYAKIGFGHVHIDQNPIEHCFRPGKVGLSNRLFIRPGRRLALCRYLLRRRDMQARRRESGKLSHLGFAAARSWNKSHDRLGPPALTILRDSPKATTPSCIAHRHLSS